MRLSVHLATLAVALLSSAATYSTAAAQGAAVATFGAGCYWCVEADFDKVKGVLKTTPGFMGGTTSNPTYAEVSSGRTGHTEVVNVEFDPAQVSYQQLLDYYWMHVDPFDADGQFCDRGSQYRPAIFVHDDAQKTLAEASKAQTAARLRMPIVVEIAAAQTLTPAPDPDFYLNNPIRYKYYRAGCGRDARIKAVWSGKAG